MPLRRKLPMRWSLPRSGSCSEPGNAVRCPVSSNSALLAVLKASALARRDSASAMLTSMSSVPLARNSSARSSSAAATSMRMCTSPRRLITRGSSVAWLCWRTKRKVASSRLRALCRSCRLLARGCPAAIGWVKAFMVDSSVPGVARRLYAVEQVVADQVEFPARRVVQRMGAGVAPVTVEVVFAEHRAGTGQFEELAAGEQGDFGGQHLGLGDHHRGVRHRVFIGVEQRGVNGLAGLFQDRFATPHTPFEIADGGNAERVLPAVVLAAVDPWPRFTGVALGFFQGTHGDTGVHGGLDDRSEE